MKRLLSLAAVTLVSILTLIPASALAAGRHHHVGAPSVFPKVVDPWRGWGIDHRHGHTHKVIPHGLGHHGSPVHVAPVIPRHRHHAPVYSTGPVWVPPAWHWNGVAWHLVPGYWAW